MMTSDPGFPFDLSPRIVQTALGPVECAIFGDGRTAIAIHGAMGGWDQSAILAKTVLGSGFRVIALSRPGYLGTPVGPGFSPDDQARRLAALMDALDVEAADILAISGGGPCASAFAAGYPHRCRSLLLFSALTQRHSFDIPTSFRIVKFLARFPFMVRTMKKSALANPARSWRKSITKPDLLHKLLLDGDAFALANALSASTFDRMRARIAGMDNDIKVAAALDLALERIAAPTLIVHGTADPLVSFQDQAKAAQSRIPNARLLPLAEGEHAAIFTHRRQVMEAVASFLAQSQPVTRT